MKMYYSLIDTPLGTMGYVFRQTEEAPKAVRIFLPRDSPLTEALISEEYPDATEREPESFSALASCLAGFFKGAHDHMPMSLVDVTVCGRFQIQVLRAERTIPRGYAASYAWIAAKIGTKAYRAVGNALARNPFPIVVPCHRAIRSDRTLGGFQGGLQMKKWILQMEGVEFDDNGKVHPDYIME